MTNDFWIGGRQAGERGRLRHATSLHRMVHGQASDWLDPGVVVVLAVAFAVGLVLGALSGIARCLVP